MITKTHAIYKHGLTFRVYNHVTPVWLKVAKLFHLFAGCLPFFQNNIERERWEMRVYAIFCTFWVHIDILCLCGVHILYFSIFVCMSIKCYVLLILLILWLFFMYVCKPIFFLTLALIDIGTNQRFWIEWKGIKTTWLVESHNFTHLLKKRCIFEDMVAQKPTTKSFKEKWNRAGLQFKHPTVKPQQMSEGFLACI